MEWMKIRKAYLILIDLCCYFISSLVFIFILDNGAPSYMSMSQRMVQMGLMILCMFICRLCLQVYANVWRYAHANEYFGLILADFLGGLIYLIIRAAMPVKIEFIRAVSIIAVACLASLAARFCYQILRAYMRQRETGTTGAENINIAIIGAGRLGTSLVSELLNSRGIVYNATENKRRRYNPVCFFDNDTQKIGSMIEGIRVF